MEALLAKRGCEAERLVLDIYFIDQLFWQVLIGGLLSLLIRLQTSAYRMKLLACWQTSQSLGQSSTRRYERADDTKNGFTNSAILQTSSTVFQEQVISLS